MLLCRRNDLLLLEENGTIAATSRADVTATSAPGAA